MSVVYTCKGFLAFFLASLTDKWLGLYLSVICWHFCLDLCIFYCYMNLIYLERLLTSVFIVNFIIYNLV